MDLSTLQTLVGDLTNDPGHDRYSLSQINTELDNSQNSWNVFAGILTDTVTLTVVAGTRQYAISSLTGILIGVNRVTHKGLLLKQRNQAFFDLYAGGVDWTTITGTPKYYFLDVTDPDTQYINLYPTPQSANAGANLVVEYIKQHTSMSAASDAPFNSNTLTQPYHYGLAYDVASRLLIRDPNPINAQKVIPYKKIADDIAAEVVQVFSALEDEIPLRLRSNQIPVGLGASNWRSYW